jgi:hypothetical protein
MEGRLAAAYTEQSDRHHLKFLIPSADYTVDFFETAIIDLD